MDSENKINELKSIIEWIEEDLREGLEVDLEELIHLREELLKLESSV